MGKLSPHFQRYVYICIYVYIYIHMCVCIPVFSPLINRISDPRYIPLLFDSRVDPLDARARGYRSVYIPCYKPCRVRIINTLTVTSHLSNSGPIRSILFGASCRAGNAASVGMTISRKSQRARDFARASVNLSRIDSVGDTSSRRSRALSIRRSG